MKSITTSPEKDYTIKEAKQAVKWYRETYGIDHSQLLGFYCPGEALNDFVKKLYAGKAGRKK